MYFLSIRSARYNQLAADWQHSNVELRQYVEQIAIVTEQIQTRIGDLAFDDFVLERGQCESFDPHLLRTCSL